MTAYNTKWETIEYSELIEDSAFGPRFSGDAYAEDGNVATLRTTDISGDGTISLSTMPLANLSFDKFASHFLKKGDLVITRSGRVGTTAIFNGFEMPVLPGAFLIRFRLKSEANPYFYRYWFNSSTGQNTLLSVARGAAQQNINITNVKKIKIPKPSIAEQNRIVSILRSYDDLIENNRRRIQLLEESARLLYKEWFVRLRFPGHEHVKLVDGIPKGWKKKTLSSIANITMGQSPKSEFYNSEGIGLPFHQGVRDFGLRFPKNVTYCTVKNRLAEAGDILFSVRAPVGRINVSTERIVIGRGLSAIRSKRSQQGFLLYNLKSHFFKEDMIGAGAIYAAITKKDLHNVELLQPSDSTVEMFQDHVTPIDRQIEVITNQTTALAQARDLLLPRLMNGEVAV